MKTKEAREMEAVEEGRGTTDQHSSLQPSPHTFRACTTGAKPCDIQGVKAKARAAPGLPSCSCAEEQEARSYSQLPRDFQK